MTINFYPPADVVKKIKGISCNSKRSYCIACRFYSGIGYEYLFMTRGGNFWILTPARRVFLISPEAAACYMAGFFVPFFMGGFQCSALSIPYGEGSARKIWAAVPVPDLSSAARKSIEWHLLPLPAVVKERVERFEETGRLDEVCLQALLLSCETANLVAEDSKR